MPQTWGQQDIVEAEIIGMHPDKPGPSTPTLLYAQTIAAL